MILRCNRVLLHNYDKSKYHRFMVFSPNNRMRVTQSPRGRKTRSKLRSKKTLTKEKAQEIQCVSGSVCSFAGHRGAEGRYDQSHSNDVVRSTAGRPAMKKHCLGQGWGKYGSCAQNGTRKYFRGMVHSLLSMLSHSPPPDQCLYIVKNTCIYTHIKLHRDFTLIKIVNK